MPASPNPWFSLLRDASAARIRLYCFPYAGAGHTVYQHWRTQLPAEIELALIKLPGRGERFGEPPATSLDALVGMLAQAIEHAEQGPEHFAFFGHSMGALLAFETARTLQKRGLSPSTLLVSARTAPSVHGWRERLSDLPDAAFFEHIRSMNGLPEELCDNPEWLALFLPIIRADFALCENYSYRPEQALTCPISVLAGRDDANVPLALLDAWAIETQAGCQTQLFEGGHFYLFEREAELLNLIQHQLGPQRRSWHAAV